MPDVVEPAAPAPARRMGAVSERPDILDLVHVVRPGFEPTVLTVDGVGESHPGGGTFTVAGRVAACGPPISYVAEGGAEWRDDCRLHTGHDGLHDCRPEPSPEGRPAELADVAEAMRRIAGGLHVDFDAFRQAWEPVCEVVLTAFAEIGGQLQKIASAVEGIADVMETEKPATRTAVPIPRVPVYTDSRPRWQSPYGPARRR